MARTQSFLVKALLLYLVLLPTIGTRAAAQGGVDPTPFDPPQPVGPRPTPGSGVPFTALAEPLTVRSLNGFTSDATAGYFSHDKHTHDGGVITVDSPWGERLDIRYWLTPHGFSFEYDDDLVVRYLFDEDGTLAEVVAESPDREARMFVGNRAQLAALGQKEFSSFDLSAYEVIEESMRAKHSDAFVDGMREAQGFLEASCATSLVQCAACIIGWAATVPAVAAACVVGGIPTFGLACFAAILAHEGAGIGCAATCVDAAHDCRGRPRGQVYPDGCEPTN